MPQGTSQWACTSATGDRRLIREMTFMGVILLRFV